MIEHSPTITKVLTAIHAVQKTVDGVSKNATNPHFRNRYASFEAVVDTIREPYLAAGLVVMQGPGDFINNTLSVTTMIAHAESGEWIKSTIQIPVGKSDPQGAGSAQSYAQRYSLMALFNLPAVDDDGEGAVRPPPQREPFKEVREQVTASLATTPKAVEPVDAHAPPYMAEVARIRSAFEACKTPEQYYGLVQRDSFIASHDGLPSAGKALVNRDMAATRQRLGIKGDSNARAAG